VGWEERTLNAGDLEWMPKHDSCCKDEWPICKWRHGSEAGQYETRFLSMLMIRW